MYMAWSQSPLRVMTMANPECTHSRPQRLGRARALLALWRQRVRSRHELGRLDSRMLRDIGIDPLDAVIESRKPFWRQ
jgi:uncharacterized protein YjiS (DUF1127 family)